MGMAFTLERYLQTAPAHFDLVPHPHTATSLQAAHACHISGSRFAKAVMLEDDERHYLMAVLPATQQVELDPICAYTGRRMHLADEEELAKIFPDCESGAVPPLGSAYGMRTVWDGTLLGQPDLYFEAGDHATLVHMKTSDFIRLLGDADTLDFAVPMRGNAIAWRDLDFTAMAADESWRDLDDSN